MGLSRHYLCDPCVGARTHTPPRSLAALVHSFTKDNGLIPREKGSTRGCTPTMQLLWGAVCRGCSHSIHLRAPTLAWPPDCSDRGAHRRRAARPFTPRVTGTVTLSQMWRRFMSDMDN